VHAGFDHAGFVDVAPHALHEALHASKLFRSEVHDIRNWIQRELGCNWRGMFLFEIWSCWGDAKINHFTTVNELVSSFSDLFQLSNILIKKPYKEAVSSS
jgi:hypothetical protein